MKVIKVYSKKGIDFTKKANVLITEKKQTKFKEAPKQMHIQLKLNFTAKQKFSNKV